MLQRRRQVAKTESVARRTIGAEAGYDPLGDRVLVRQVKAAEEVGGILLPGTSTEAPPEGHVLAVGHRVVEKSKIVVGARVRFKEYGGTVLEVDDEGCKIWLLHEEDLMAVVK